MIGEILGQLIRDMSYGSEYCFQIGDDTILEPESPFRFINHSCDPNCEFDWFDVVSATETTRRKRVFLFAIVDIKPGDELTIDYNWPAAATNFYSGESVLAKVTMNHTWGQSEITGATISIFDPSNNQVVTSQAMLSDGTGPTWERFRYTYNLPIPAERGLWRINVTGTGTGSQSGRSLMRL